MIGIYTSCACGSHKIYNPAKNTVLFPVAYIVQTHDRHFAFRIDCRRISLDLKAFVKERLLWSQAAKNKKNI